VVLGDAAIRRRGGAIMTLSRPLLWKEWAESRSILMISAIIFLVLPLIGAVEHIVQYGHFEIWTSPWVLSLGGVLAVVAAAGTIIPDVTRRFEFIRSQPIPLTRWLLAKYAVGLSVVLAVLIVSLALELITDRPTTSTGFYRTALLVTLPFTWIAIYSIAFALACLIRRTALTVVAGIFAMIVLYFLPPLVPGLEMLSLSRVTDDLSRQTFGNTIVQRPGLAALHPSYFLFTATLLAITAIVLCIAVVAINRDWRIESNRRAIVWAMAILVLAPVTTASLQLGANMPVLQKLDVDEKEEIVRFMPDSGGGILFSSRTIGMSPITRQPLVQIFARRVTPGLQLTVGPKIPVENDGWGGGWNASPAHNICYAFTAMLAPDPTEQQDNPHRTEYPILFAMRIQDKSIESTSLEMKDHPSTDFGMPIFAYHGSTLTVVSGKHELSFNSTDPMHPKLISMKPLNTSPHLNETPNGFAFIYPAESSMSADELLAGFEHEYWWENAGDLKTFVVIHEGKLRCYARSDSQPGMVKFDLAGQYTPLPLETMFHGIADGRIGFNNGLLTTTSHLDVSLFDVSNPSYPRRIGHYAEPTRHYKVLDVLPDGRVILSNDNHLVVLGRP
jgi:hypothetical protein